MSDIGVEVLGPDGASLRGIRVEGDTLLETLRRLGAGLPETPCGGAGLCGKCRVVIVSGDAGDVDAQERRFLNDTELEGGVRLACRAKPHGAVSLRLPERGGAAIVGRPSAIHETGDPAFRDRGTFGVAVDIGTTTIAAYLIRTSDSCPAARVLKSSSRLNSQRGYGADVIARIDYAARRGGLEVLAEAVRSDVRWLIDESLFDVGAPREALRVVSVVGNPTMLHLFSGVDPSGIAMAPFVPAFLEARSGAAEDFNLPYPGATVTLGPSVAAYVGADLVAAIRAVGLESRDKPALILDLGTNGEMALGDSSGILCCATAAGSAFEGASISRGVGGIRGAVDSFRWDGHALGWTTIDAAAPIGICGSGIVDAVACLLSARIVDESGAMEDQWRVEGYPLVSQNGRDLRFTQGDVRETQLAVAAVAAGIATLLNERGMDLDEVDRVFIAGSFGGFLNPASAAAIGLIPKALLSKVEFVGNAAGKGACRMLLFADELERSEELARRCRYIELSTSTYFADRFVEEMGFPSIGELGKGSSGWGE